MPPKKTGIKAKPPKSIVTKPLDIDYKALLTASAKGIKHGLTGNFDDAFEDSLDVFASLGLAKDASELAHTLINRSLLLGIARLLNDRAADALRDSQDNIDTIVASIAETFKSRSIDVPNDFMEHPERLEVLADVSAVLVELLRSMQISQPEATGIANALPEYFVNALISQWRKGKDKYQPLVDALDTPFTKASERMWAWREYASYLQRKVHEGMFAGTLSLAQLYVPLNAYTKVKEKSKRGAVETVRRDVAPLRELIDKWLAAGNKNDAMRVISGGPGSGKSSSLRMLAADLSRAGQKVLFFELHDLNPTGELVKEVNDYLKETRILSTHNPLDEEDNLILIFDGLDELASQGKAAVDSAREFAEKVNRFLDRRNHMALNMRAILGGRELVVQASESEFRNEGEILTLLPYHIKEDELEKYNDPQDLLKQDLRPQWWERYAIHTGKEYKGLPGELSRDDLAEITAQPLLNYLVAMSYEGGDVDFKQSVSLNKIYYDMVEKIYARGWGRHKHLKDLEFNDFMRVLEEIGLAAWHGGESRSTTIKQIEKLCDKRHLEAFREGAEAGITRLLAAFFFRQHDRTNDGDQTFVFTHKSFGEYLAACRIVRAMDLVSNQFVNKSEIGWDENASLKRWAKLCGPSPLTFEILKFIRNEVALRKKEASKWQGVFVDLFNHVLKHKMPMDKLGLPFSEQLEQFRNASATLFACMNACALATEQISIINQQDKTAFGSWLRMVQGQRIKWGEMNLVQLCLSYIDLSRFCLCLTHLQPADLRMANLCGADLRMANLFGADLSGADLSGADLSDADLRGAGLSKTNLSEAALFNSNLREADLRGAYLRKSDLAHARLNGAILTHAVLCEANLTQADFSQLHVHDGQGGNTYHHGANLMKADLSMANLSGANLCGADLNKANLKRAILQNTDFTGAILDNIIVDDGNREYLKRFIDSKDHKKDSGTE